VTLCADCFEDRSDETLVDEGGNVLPCPACGSTRMSNVAEPEPAAESSPATDSRAIATRRTCTYGPCDLPPLRPNGQQGWQSRYCSWGHVQAAKTTPEAVAATMVERPPRPMLLRDPEPNLPAALTDLRRRYFELLMDLAAKHPDPCPGTLLDRIERVLETLP